MKLESNHHDVFRRQNIVYKIMFDKYTNFLMFCPGCETHEKININLKFSHVL